MRLRRVAVVVLSMAFPLTLSASRLAECSNRTFAQMLTEFVQERNALLSDPDASVSDYRQLAERYGAGVDYASLTIDDLARGAFEGMFDSPAAQKQAEQRLVSLPDEPAALSARAAVIRLRLLGASTVFDLPPPERRAKLVAAVLENPGLLSLWRSPEAAEVVDVLCTGGCSAALKEHRDRIDELLASLDPSGDLSLATRLDSLVLLAMLSTTDKEQFRGDVATILAFGRASLSTNPAPSTREEMEAQLAWVEGVASGAFPVGGPDLDRVDLSLAALEDVMAEDRKAYARFVRYLGNMIYAGMLAGGELDTRFLLQKPVQETVLDVPRSAYEVPAQTTFRASELVRSADGRVFRAFGGFELDDPVIRFSCSDVAVDESQGFGFVRDLSLRGQLASLRVDSIDVAGGEWTATDARIGARVGPLPIVDVSAGALRQDEPGIARLEEGRLRLFGITVVRIPDREFSPEVGEDGGEEAAEAEPRGKSPSLLWYKLPSIGVQEGGISFAYSNSLKFEERWTGSVGFRTAPGHPTGYYLGANYNLLSITNERDLFLTATDLQQDSLGSYFFQVENREPLRENADLFEPTLFAGAYTAINRLYIDVSGDSRTLSIPVSLGIEGGSDIGDTIGVRAQVSYEKVREEGIGEESRLVLMGAAGPRPLRVGRGVDLILRAEGITRSGDNQYAWYRGIAGVTALLHPDARLSLGCVRSWEDGTPTFPYDRVAADRGYVARLDLSRGPYAFSYLNQYSQDQRAWARSEWLLSRAFNVAEVYLAFDQLYSRYSFGFIVGIDQLYDKVARRKVMSVDSGERVLSAPARP